MERLTMRDVGGRAFWVSHQSLGGGYCLVADTEDVRRLDRLAAYEDTGLEPGDITPEPYGCVFYCNRKCNLDGDWCTEGPGCPNEIRAETIKHLLELAQAEKDGRLVVLPCKPGAPVWEIGDFDGGNLKKRPFSVEDMSFWRFGTTVFLTREEAEAALKKREEAENETD